MDAQALRTRVLLTGLVSLLLLTACAVVVAALHAPDYWLAGGLIVLYVAVIRPMLAPVRAATRQRKALAYQAFLESRRDPP